MNRVSLFFALFLVTFIAKPNLTSNLSVDTGVDEFNVDFVIDDITDVVKLTITGPEDKYFAIGFGTDEMLDSYAIVCNQTGVSVEERKLGNHNAGSILTSTITLDSTSIANGQKTLFISRPLTGPTADYFDFSKVTAGVGVTAIYSIGFSQVLSYHGATGKGITSLMFADNLVATENELFKQSIAIYPNPASSEVNVTFERSSGTTQVQVMTLQGQVVLTKSYDANAKISVELTDIQAGHYLLMIKNEEHEAMFSLVKE